MSLGLTYHLKLVTFHEIEFQLKEGISESTNGIFRKFHNSQKTKFTLKTCKKIVEHKNDY